MSDEKRSGSTGGNREPTIAELAAAVADLHDKLMIAGKEIRTLNEKLVLLQAGIMNVNNNAINGMLVAMATSNQEKRSELLKQVMSVQKHVEKTILATMSQNFVYSDEMLHMKLNQDDNT